MKKWKANIEMQNKRVKAIREASLERLRASSLRMSASPHKQDSDEPEAKALAESQAVFTTSSRPPLSVQSAKALSSAQKPKGILKDPSESKDKSEAHDKHKESDQSRGRDRERDRDRGREDNKSKRTEKADEGLKGQEAGSPNKDHEAKGPSQSHRSDKKKKKKKQPETTPTKVATQIGPADPTAVREGSGQPEPTEDAEQTEEHAGTNEKLPKTLDEYTRLILDIVEKGKASTKAAKVKKIKRLLKDLEHGGQQTVTELESQVAKYRQQWDTARQKCNTSTKVISELEAKLFDSEKDKVPAAVTL